jgi:hypothetical protein
LYNEYKHVGTSVGIVGLVVYSQEEKDSDDEEG